MTRWFAILAVSLLVACGTRHPPAPAAAAAQHVVIITIDTLRADRLGCYGSRDVATPNMDRLAREGALAINATVHVPLTRPSHVSIFTGLYPPQHGIRDNVSPALALEIPTLAEVFRAAGFRTAGFVSSIVLSRQSGLGRGFEEFSDSFDVGTDDARFLNGLQKRGDEATAAASKWLEAHAQDRTFTWVHLYDPHAPYEPPEPYASQYADRPYDGEVAWTDDLLGRLDAALMRLGIRDQTLELVTSDHGEGLGDHDESVHGFFVYESTLRVPFIVRGPGIVPGMRFSFVTRSVDVFPTVVDLAGVSLPKHSRRLPGRTIAAALRGTTTLSEEPSFAESLTPQLHFGWSDLQTLRDGRWKYILAPKPELYDLERDPGELTNLIEAEPARARALETGLERHLTAMRPAGASDAKAGEIPADLVEKLAALGYVAGGAPAKHADTGADPKDKIGEYKVLSKLLREGVSTLLLKNYGASAERFRTLAAHGVDSFESHYYFGRALAGLRRWREAAGQFQRAIELLPAYSAAYLSLADCFAASGDLKAAIAALREGERATPADPRLYDREAEMWQRAENRPAAIRAYESELPYAQKDAVVRVRLAQLLRDSGDLSKAEKYLREAVALDSSDGSYWNSLGMIVGARGDLTEAERLFREAVQRDPREPRYTYNLGLTLQREGRVADAAPYFRKTLELNSGFAAARQRLAEIGQDR